MNIWCADRTTLCIVRPTWDLHRCLISHLYPVKVLSSHIRIITENPSVSYGQLWLLIEHSAQPRIRTQFQAIRAVKSWILFTIPTVGQGHARIHITNGRAGPRSYSHHGRSIRATLVFISPTVGPNHARIHYTNGRPEPRSYPQHQLSTQAMLLFYRSACAILISNKILIVVCRLILTLHHLLSLRGIRQYYQA